MLTQPRWFVWKVKVEKSKTELLHVLVEANMRNRFRFSKPWKYEFLVKIDTRQKNENGEQIFFSKLIHWIFIFNIGRGFGVLIQEKTHPFQWGSSNLMICLDLNLIREDAKIFFITETIMFFSSPKT
jgi:hypothetical protein